MKNAPVGVRIVSVVFFLAALIFAGVGLVMFAGAASGISQFGIIVFIALGIVTVVFGILDATVGWALWTGQSWARPAAIVLLLLGIIWGAAGIIGGELVFSPAMLLIYALGAAYLAFSKRVRRAFAS